MTDKLICLLSKYTTLSCASFCEKSSLTEQSCQQIKGSDPAPLFCADEAPPGVQCPVLGSQDRTYGHTAESSEGPGKLLKELSISPMRKG